MTAALLRRAAAHIERLSADVAPGPWSWEVCEDWGCGAWHHVTDTNGLPVAQGGYEGGGVEREADAAWIAALGPNVAVPLVDLLRSAADDLEHTVSHVWTDLTPEQAAMRAEQEWFRRPLALARAIIGEQP